MLFKPLYSNSNPLYVLGFLSRATISGLIRLTRLSLTHLIHHQLNRFIEVTEGVEDIHQSVKMIRQSPVSLSISFLTKTIYRLPAAHIISSSLKHKLDLPDSLRDDITSALHEAILNCVVHGNLEIDNDFSDHASFSEYYDTIDDRLNDHHYSGRRANIHIIWTDSQIAIAVTDEGSKNRMVSAYSTGHHNKHLNGRGIQIIESCSSHISWSTDGRTLTMIFLR